MVVALHSVPISIISTPDVCFTSRFWKRVNEELGTRSHFNIAYYPQTNDQSERTIKTLEDMLMACIIDFGGRWDSYFPLDDFSYNNSYHAIISMLPWRLGNFEPLFVGERLDGELWGS